MRFLQFLFHKVSVEEHFMECHSKCDYFLKFFDKNIKANIFQSNLYVQQKQKGKSILPVKERLYGSMALWDTISYHHGLTADFAVPGVSSVISRLRLGQILCNLHVNVNSAISAENKDKLFKLRPLITSLKEKYVKLYDVSWYLSVDESMILFKGRSSIKHYDPKKTNEKRL